MRHDEEVASAIVRKSTYERLILCDYAVVDLTTASPTVFYELGVRHATRKTTIVCLFAGGRGQLPFDVTMLRVVPYQLGADGNPVNVANDCETLGNRLKAAAGDLPDSPVFTLFGEVRDAERLRREVFNEQVRYSEDHPDKR